MYITISVKSGLDFASATKYGDSTPILERGGDIDVSDDALLRAMEIIENDMRGDKEYATANPSQ